MAPAAGRAKLGDNHSLAGYIGRLCAVRQRRARHLPNAARARPTSLKLGNGGKNAIGAQGKLKALRGPHQTGGWRAVTKSGPVARRVIGVHELRP